MREYLKMSRHFTGAVTINYNGHICDDKSFFGSTDIAEDYYEHVCHAINSHDELVDSLQSVTKERDELARKLDIAESTLFEVERVLSEMQRNGIFGLDDIAAEVEGCVKRLSE